MFSIRAVRAAGLVLVAILGLASCRTDPNVAKVRYLQSGNKYFDRGKFKEARIMYLRAKSRDQRYGEAYYRLGLVDLRLGSVTEAVNSFRRSVELIPADGPNAADHWDSVVKLAELYLAFAPEKQYLNEVQGFSDMLLKRDPNSFDGHRLAASLAFARAGLEYKVANRDQGAKLLDESIVEFRKADAIKPGQQGVMMQLARALAARNDFNGAEELYRRVIEADKTYQPAYSELYKLYIFQKKMAEGEQILKAAFQNNPKVYAYLTMLAMHYYVERRRDDMLGVLQQIKSHAKDYDQAYLQVGLFYVRLGDADSAIREYREGMAKDPKKKATYQKSIIEILMRQGKRQEAADMTEQILKDDPKDTDALGLKATFLLDKGDINRALAELQAVVTRAPDNPVAHYNLGRAHAARQEWEQARQQFQKAIELRPDYVLARLALAQLQVTRGEFEAALKTAEQILAIDRGNVNARLIESAALMGQRKFGESRQLLESMLKAAPNSPDVLFQVGVVNLAENKFKEAEEAFRRAYELNPANSRGLMGMVENDMAQNKPDAAIALLQAEAAKYPNRMDYHLAIGNTAVRAGRFDMAVAEFQKVLDSIDKTSKTRGDLYLRIGETYRRKGDLGNAILNLQKARETLPENVIVLSTLALSLDGARRPSEARQVYEATIKLDPNNGVSLNNLAFLLAENGGDLNQALTLAQHAKQLLPNLNEVSDTLGWIYLKKNLADDAVKIFKGLVDKAPQQATFHFHLGLALSQKGDKTQAIKELQEALKNNPTKEDREKIQALIQRLS